MSHPSPQQLSVATATLRAEAGIWEDSGGQLSQCTPVLQSLDTTSLQVSVFAPFAGAYAKVVQQAVERCTEGAPALTTVGTVLRAAADAYDAEEAAGEHRIRNLY